MVLNQTVKTKSASIHTAVTMGTVMTLLVTVVGAVIGTFMISYETVAESNTLLLSIVIWAISAFAGTLVSSTLSKERFLLSLASTSTCYFFLLCVTGILFFESNFKTALTAFFAIVAGSILVVFIVLNAKPRNNRRKRYQIR